MKALFDKINAINLGEDRKKDFKYFLIIFAVYFAYGVFWKIKNGWYTVDSYVTTLFSFSYLKDGFIRRGLIGTIYNTIGIVFPSILNYKGLYYFIWILTLAYLYCLIIFCKWAFSKIKDIKIYRVAYFVTLFMLAFLVPTACYSAGAFGRADLIQMAIVLLQVYMMVENKWTWATIPLTGINVLFHEGYAIMTFNVVFFLLIYKVIREKGHRLYNFIILALNLAIIVYLSLYSLRNSGAGTYEAYMSALEYARSLNSLEAVHHNLLNMMAGYYDTTVTITTDDNILVVEQLGELPVFLVCFAPVFYLFIKYVVNLFICLKKKHKGTYITALILGPLLISYQFKTYCDYGRYVQWLFFYFLIVLLAMLASDDEPVGNALIKSFDYSNVKALLLIVLAIFYQPLGTCFFTTPSRLIKKYFFS